MGWPGAGGRQRRQVARGGGAWRRQVVAAAVGGPKDAAGRLGRRTSFTRRFSDLCGR